MKLKLNCNCLRKTSYQLVRRTHIPIIVLVSAGNNYEDGYMLVEATSKVGLVILEGGKSSKNSLCH